MPDTERRSDEMTMLTVKGGQLEQLAILFERHHNSLFNFLFRLTGTRASAEDLVQEVFFRVLKYRHTYSGEGKFVIWMFRIARRVHLDFLKKQVDAFPLEEQWHEKEDSNPLPEEKASRQEEVELIHRALGQLPVRKREILLLSRFHHFKYREIAQLYGCSIESVKVQVHRAIKELRTAFLGLKGGAA